MRRNFSSSEELCEYISSRTGSEVILSFSGGKDAIATWLQLRRFFKRVVPYHYWLVPGLQFVEDGLRQAENFFGTEILRLPSPALSRMLRNNVHQSPATCRHWSAAELPPLTHEKIENHVRTIRLCESAFIAVGARISDSVARRARIKKYGPCNPGARKFQAIYDWNIDRLDKELSLSGCKLPKYYQYLASSFDGISTRWLMPIREQYPDDYARIKRLFPMAESDLFRYEFATRHIGENT